MEWKDLHPQRPHSCGVLAGRCIRWQALPSPAELSLSQALARSISQCSHVETWLCLLLQPESLVQATAQPFRDTLLLCSCLRSLQLLSASI